MNPQFLAFKHCQALFDNVTFSLTRMALPGMPGLTMAIIKLIFHPTVDLIRRMIDQSLNMPVKS